MYLYLSVSGVATNKEPVSSGSGGGSPLKLEMFSCRGWQKFMSGNCSFVFSMHNNWWMITIESITASFDFIYIFFLFYLNRFDLKNVQHIRNSYIHWYNNPVELRLHGTRKNYKTWGINRKCKSNNLNKIRINNKNNETNKGLKQIWVARTQQQTRCIQAIAC